MEFFKENIIPGEVIVQMIAFIIVFLALKRLAWNPLLASLENRRDKIRKDLQYVETARREVENLKQEYAAHLQKIDDEARAKIQEHIEEGRQISREIQDKARQESQASFEKAKENLGLEIAKARAELRKEIAGLAVTAAARVLNEKMADEQKQNEKVMEILEELDKKL